MKSRAIKQHLVGFYLVVLWASELRHNQSLPGRTKVKCSWILGNESCDTIDFYIIKNLSCYVHSILIPYQCNFYRLHSLYWNLIVETFGWPPNPQIAEFVDLIEVKYKKLMLSTVLYSSFAHRKNSTLDL